jgi:hypothetical protein
MVPKFYNHKIPKAMTNKNLKKCCSSAKLTLRMTYVHQNANPCSIMLSVVTSFKCHSVANFIKLFLAQLTPLSAYCCKL